MITTFEKSLKQKKFFDPNNQDDVEYYRSFLKHSKWSSEGCPFFLEKPYLSIPHMIQDKLVKNFLQI